MVAVADGDSVPVAVRRSPLPACLPANGRRGRRRRGGGCWARSKATAAVAGCLLDGNSPRYWDASFLACRKRRGPGRAEAAVTSPTSANGRVDALAGWMAEMHLLGPDDGDGDGDVAELAERTKLK